MNPDPEIRETSSPSHDLLMLADESPGSLPAGPSANTCCSTHAPSRPR